MSVKLVKRLLLVIPLAIVSCSNEPSFELLDGSSAKLLADKRLQLINYWATWCLPCLEEMPELAEFRKKHIQEVDVFAVNYDRLGVDELREAVNELDVEIPALLTDPNEILGYDRPQVLPTTIVMLAGEVQEVMVGPQNMETLESILDKWR